MPFPVSPPVPLPPRSARKEPTKASGGTAVDKAGNSAQATVSGINIDETAPTVTYTGNAGTYTTSQTIAIACTASDALSGIATTTCANIDGSASSFGVGVHNYSATATDKAGNVGSGSTSFTVTAPVAPFTITPTPSAETIQRGVIAGFLLTLKSLDAFKGNVTLSCSGGPAGSDCVDLPQTVHLNGTAYALSGILFPKNSAPGTYVITFTGTSGSSSTEATATFTVK